jgi:hypothetical protein
MKLVTLCFGLVACSHLPDRSPRNVDVPPAEAGGADEKGDEYGGEQEDIEAYDDWLGSGGCIRAAELSSLLDDLLGADGDGGARTGRRTFKALGNLGSTLLVGVGEAVVATPEGLASRHASRESDRPGTIWAVDCANPQTPPTPYLQVSGADFGSAVLSPSPRSLVFESRYGLSLLEIDSKTIADFVARPPGRVLVPLDWSAHGLIVDVQRAKVPFPDAVLLESWVIDPTTQESRDERHWARRSGIATLVRHTDGTLYLGDGACDGPAREDPARHALWRSVDLGDTWTALPLASGAKRASRGGARIQTGVVDVVVDTRDPRLMAVLTRSCPRDLTWAEIARGERHAKHAHPEDAFGGEVLVTGDGGKTWVQLAPSAIFGDSGHTIAHRLWSPSGNARHLRAAHIETYDRDTPHGGFYEVASVHETHDGGKTWVDISENDDYAHFESRPGPPIDIGRVPGHIMLERSPRGLIRSDDAQRVLFPPASRR